MFKLVDIQLYEISTPLLPSNTRRLTLMVCLLQAGSACKRHVCQGSVVQPKADQCPHYSGKIVNMAEMKDFYNQYFTSTELW